MKVVGAGGFEPPTAWFVARYSIQLSYAPTFILLVLTLSRVCKEWWAQEDSNLRPPGS